MESVKYQAIKLENVSKQSLKSSQEKSFRKQLLESIPKIEQIIDQIWTKKTEIQTGKVENFRIYFIGDEPCFLQGKEGPIIPHLKLLHKYPFLLPTCQVDAGGIKHLISGADVMIPGMTSEKGKLPTEKEIPHNIVAVMCEGMENAIAIGQMQMSAEEMKEKGKGVGVKVYTYLGDDTWNQQSYYFYHHISYYIYKILASFHKRFFLLGLILYLMLRYLWALYFERFQRKHSLLLGILLNLNL